jgi:hypothetical protein
VKIINNKLIDEQQASRMIWPKPHLERNIIILGDDQLAETPKDASDDRIWMLMYDE